MRIERASKLDNSRKSEIFRLWNTEYPKNLSYQSVSEFDAYIESLGGVQHFLLIDESDKIIGWAISFTRENGVWFALIIASAAQGNGYGELMLNTLKDNYPSLNGWVIDHSNYMRSDDTPYKSPLGFYLKNGFKLVPNKSLKNDKISAVMIEARGLTNH